MVENALAACPEELLDEGEAPRWVARARQPLRDPDA